jgi:coenzyme F420-0:L-glutamate ligase/coenzyme F420-1:gamma-L-glutamate ligase
MTVIPSFSAFAIPDIPMIQEGDDLVDIILACVIKAGFVIQDDDVLVISSKIISKAQGRRVDLNTVEPSVEAVELAQETAKDPRIVELILQESTAVSRKRKGVLVTQHRLGFVSANSGIDQSNIQDGDTAVLLLPLDPDESAQDIQSAIGEKLDVTVGIVVSDTHGRPFRIGNIGVAIGVAGLPSIKDLRGRKDLFGRTLEISQVAYADLVASAAHLLCGEADEGYPVVVLRGVDISPPHGQAHELNRLPENDLYR